jgi:CheY-like chemotaxis protein
MLRRLRVLVVEDEDLVRSVATDELRDAGFDVVEAASGDEALRAIDADPSLDALFTDIRLGAGPDGWEVAQIFRSRHPEDPVIYASGYSPGEPRRLSNSLFFPKPYRPSRITAALKLMLAASRWEPEAEAVGEPRDPAPAMLTRLTYMSRPTPLAHDPSPAEGLMRLTQQVRTLNRAQGLTGALLAGAEWFIQVLEGERTALLAALERINRDPRHQDVRIFELTAASSRLFPDWAMHVGRTEEVEPELLWRCVEAFRQPGPLGAKLLLEALGRSTRAAA